MNNSQTLVLYRTKKKKNYWDNNVLLPWSSPPCRNYMYRESGPFSCGRGPKDYGIKFYSWHSCSPWHVQLSLFCQIVSFSQAIYTQSSKPNIIKRNIVKPSSVCMILLEVSISISNCSSIGSNTPMSRRVLTEDAERQACCSPGLSHTHILPNIHRISFWSYSCDCG